MGRAEAEITIQGERLTLLPERGLLWRGGGVVGGVLFVADLHLGKSETLRAHGMAVPEMDLDEQCERLAACVERTGARELVVVGDLVHASGGLSERVMERAGALFRTLAERGVRTVVVRGNHDRHGTRLFERLAEHAGVGVVGEWRGEGGRDGGIVARHVPEWRCHGALDGARIEIAAHLHPAVSLGKGVRLPCFWVRGGSVVLPAFSRFTGGGRVEREAGDLVYAIADERVMDVSRVRARGLMSGRR